MTDSTRGVLYPERLPSMRRVPASGPVAELAAWFWAPVWDLADGQESRQEILAYPVSNLVVEASGATLWGATTRVSARVLRGSGWAVGVVLRPAATAALTAEPVRLVDAHVELGEPGLAAAVAALMPRDVDAAVAVVGEWLRSRVGALGGEARLANDAAELLMTDATILRLEDAARRLAVSSRTLQRIAHRSVGLSPAAMIRRRRLQEAAQRVRDDPGSSLAAIAAELGYADQAHLANDFRTVLGFTASDYRAAQ